MKKIMALSGVALALAGALALGGCTPRADRAARTDNGGTQQNVPAQPLPAGPVQVDTGQIDADLASIDDVLTGVDADLSAAARTPEDAD